MSGYNKMDNNMPPPPPYNPYQPHQMPPFMPQAPASSVHLSMPPQPVIVNSTVQGKSEGCCCCCCTCPFWVCGLFILLIVLAIVIPALIRG